MLRRSEEARQVGLAPPQRLRTAGTKRAATPESKAARVRRVLVPRHEGWTRQVEPSTAEGLRKRKCGRELRPPAARGQGKRRAIMGERDGGIIRRKLKLRNNWCPALSPNLTLRPIRVR